VDTQACEQDTAYSRRKLFIRTRGPCPGRWQRWRRSRGSRGGKFRNFRQRFPFRTAFELHLGLSVGATFTNPLMHLLDCDRAVMRPSAPMILYMSFPLNCACAHFTALTE